MADYQERYAQQTTTTAGGVAIDEGLRSYMLGVYNYMSLGVAFTAIMIVGLGTMPNVLMAMATGPMKWVAFAGVLGLGFFAPRLILGGSAMVAHAAYWGYAALWGLLIAPMVVPMVTVRRISSHSVACGRSSFSMARALAVTPSKMLRRLLLWLTLATLTKIVGPRVMRA